MSTTPEGKVKSKVNKLLEKYKVFKFMPVQMGMGKPGLDYFCCYSGKFFAIETKAEKKDLTPRQKETADEIRKADGVVFVIIGLDSEVFGWLEDWLIKNARTHRLTLVTPAQS